MHYGPQWQEALILRDGSLAQLRLLRVSDRDDLIDGLEHLSEASRYQRFLTAMPSLNRSQLDYLTQIDQVRHVAIVASKAGLDGSEEGVGIGRFVQLDEREGVAEPAITVIDAMQGLGLGTALMVRLCQAATERGVRTFHVEFLADNEPIRQLLEQVSDGQLELHREGPIYTGEFPIPRTPVGVPIAHSAWLELLTEAASHMRAVVRHAGNLKGKGFADQSDDGQGA